MQLVTDLHIHSKYSQAVSKYMDLPEMSRIAIQKGIDILGTGDWTHPKWMQEIQDYLYESEEGLFKFKHHTKQVDSVRYMLTVEVSNIYTDKKRGRRIHNLIISPTIQTALEINKILVKRSFNLSADGRPILKLSSKDLLELVLESNEKCLLIPCHIWTPWYGMYGKQSGYDSLQQCFGELNKYIYAIETGLSSDPEMNWNIDELATRSILSFSDAHSSTKIGRELTVFELKKLSYHAISEAIKGPYFASIGIPVDNRILHTLEFYPEEGKYHYSGHRKCNIIMTPEEQEKNDNICPQCKKKLTDGVVRRVDELSSSTYQRSAIVNNLQVKWYIDAAHNRPPFVKLIPLIEIIANSYGVGVKSKRVKSMYDKMCSQLTSELDILLKKTYQDIAAVAGEKIAQGIKKVREGKIRIEPGYDGVYGKVTIW